MKQVPDLLSVPSNYYDFAPVGHEFESFLTEPTHPPLVYRGELLAAIHR